MKKFLTTSMVAALLTGCTNLPEAPEAQDIVKEELPATTVIPQQWKEKAQQGSYDAHNFLKDFNDPQMEAIVTEALKNNYDLMSMEANVRAAQALVDKVGSKLKPQVGAYHDARRGAGGVLSNESRNISSTSLSASWETDLWGRLQARKRAANYNYEAFASDYQAARNIVAATAANIWYSAVASAQLEELADEAIELTESFIKITQSNYDNGRASTKDLHLAKANHYEMISRKHKALEAKSLAIKGLEALLGRYPADELEVATKAQDQLPTMPIGIPMDVISRRPDIIAARLRIAAALNSKHDADMARLPNITLSTNVAFGEHPDLRPSISDGFWSIGAGVVQPIFTGGAIKAQQQQKAAQLDAAKKKFIAKVLRAFSEVEATITSEREINKQQSALKFSSKHNLEALKVAITEYKLGKTSALPTLQIRMLGLEDDSNIIRLRMKRLQNRMIMHLALGGSFDQQSQDNKTAQK